MFERTSQDEKIYGVINLSVTFGLFIAAYTLPEWLFSLKRLNLLDGKSSVPGGARH